MEQSNKNQNINSKSDSDSRSVYGRFIRSASYTVWTVLGVLLITLLSVAVLGSGTWQENLNISEPVVVEESSAPESQQPAQQPQQPVEPTAEQLACISEQVGEERLAELQQGADLESEQEAAILEACLTEVQ